MYPHSTRPVRRVTPPSKSHCYPVLTPYTLTILLRTLLLLSSTDGNHHRAHYHRPFVPVSTPATGAHFSLGFFSSFRPKSPNPYHPPPPTVLYTLLYHRCCRHTNALRCRYCRFHPLYVHSSRHPVLISRNILKAPSALGRVGDTHTHTRFRPAMLLLLLLLLRSPVVITVVVVVVVVAFPLSLLGRPIVHHPSSSVLSFAPLTPSLPFAPVHRPACCYVHAHSVLYPFPNIVLILPRVRARLATVTNNLSHLLYNC